MNVPKKSSEGKSKIPHTRITFTATMEMENQLKNLADRNNMNLSKFIRKSLEKSLMPEKEKTDLEFISRQIRLEMDSILKQYEKELEEIIKSIGVYVIPQCVFTGDIIQMFAREKDPSIMEDILEQAQKEALIILSDYGDKENLKAYNKYHGEHFIAE